MNVSLKRGHTFLPIDSMGTGILQTIQICAYIYLFQPRLLLLDEPDAHLHPNNQIALADILVTLTENLSSKIILTTHSRTLISALKNSAKFFRVFEGKVTGDFEHHAMLLELGALDDLDRLHAGEYQWIILTEDTGTQSQKALRLILESNGLAPNCYKVYPYSGASNIVSAEVIGNFICSLHPQIKVLIHSDKDGRTREELQNTVKNFNNTHERMKLFITKYNDIESYFCDPRHVSELLKQDNKKVSEEEIDDLIKNLMEQIKEESIAKMITNRCRFQKCHNKQGEVAMRAREDYESSPKEYIHGKTLKGKISAELHQKYNFKYSLHSTKFLKDETLEQYFSF